MPKIKKLFCPVCGGHLITYKSQRIQKGKKEKLAYDLFDRPFWVWKPDYDLYTRYRRCEQCEYKDHQKKINEGAWVVDKILKDGQWVEPTDTPEDDDLLWEQCRKIWDSDVEKNMSPKIVKDIKGKLWLASGDYYGEEEK